MQQKSDEVVERIDEENGVACGIYGFPRLLIMCHIRAFSSRLNTGIKKFVAACMENWQLVTLQRHTGL